MNEDVLKRVRVFVMSQEPWRAIEALRLIDALAAEVRALRKDRERLDFIITDCSGLDFANEELARVFFAEVGNHDDMRVGFRAAFDAVMSARGGEDVA